MTNRGSSGSLEVRHPGKTSLQTLATEWQTHLNKMLVMIEWKCSKPPPHSKPLGQRITPLLSRRV